MMQTDFQLSSGLGSGGSGSVACSKQGDRGTRRAPVGRAGDHQQAADTGLGAKYIPYLVFTLTTPFAL